MFLIQLKKVVKSGAFFVIILMLAFLAIANSGCFESKMRFLREFGSEGKGSSDFDGPTDIAVNSKGDIYVCDTKNNRVSVFNSNCESLKTIAMGDGTSMKMPQGIGIDKSDNLYIADTGNNRILKFDATGRFHMAIYTTVKLGQLKDNSNSLRMPYDVAASANGRIYVVDMLNRLLVFDPNGVCSNKFGSKGSNSSSFDVPTRIAVAETGPADKSEMYLYVADSFNSRVIKFNYEFKNMYEIKEKGLLNFLHDPRGVAALSDKSVIISDCGSTPLCAYSPQGTLEAVGGAYGVGRGYIVSAGGVAVDQANKKVYVTDTLQNKVLVYSLYK